MARANTALQPTRLRFGERLNARRWAKDQKIQRRKNKNRKHLFFTVLLMGSMILSGCGSSVGASKGRIVFSSSSDGTSEIYVMNPDGSAQTRLTNNAADNINPI